MAGRPRSRRAAHLVARMLAVLRLGGVWRVEHLLDGCGHGATDWARLPRWQRASARMAHRDLLADPRVLQLDDGRVIYIPPALDYVPAHWTAGTAVP